MLWHLLARLEPQLAWLLCFELCVPLVYLWTLSEPASLQSDGFFSLALCSPVLIPCPAASKPAIPYLCLAPVSKWICFTCLPLPLHSSLLSPSSPAV